MNVWIAWKTFTFLNSEGRSSVHHALAATENFKSCRCWAFKRHASVACAGYTSVSYCLENSSRTPTIAIAQTGINTFQDWWIHTIHCTPISTSQRIQHGIFSQEVWTNTMNVGPTMNVWIAWKTFTFLNSEGRSSVHHALAATENFKSCRCWAFKRHASVACAGYTSVSYCLENSSRTPTIAIAQTGINTFQDFIWGSHGGCECGGSGSW